MITPSISQLKQTILTYSQSMDVQHETHLNIKDMRTEINDIPKNKIYVPTPTCSLAHNDDSLVRLVMGPYGSGKTTWAVNEIVRRVSNMPNWSNGRRRARWAIVRNTSGELQSTTLNTWLNWFGGLGDVHRRQKPILIYNHAFRDERGVVELELIFLALDRPDDVRKVKSLELTGCYLNELSEIPQAALSHMKGRVGRFPSKNDCPEPYWSGIIADTNPPDDDHWLYNDFEARQIEGYKLFKQPPGLIKIDNKWLKNPHAENIENLPDDYYERLATGQTEEFIKVFCLGQYGTVGTGRLVYPEYNDDLHAVDDIPSIQGDPIHLGWDFGLTPHCLVYQISPSGQFRALKEYGTEGMGIKTFAESIVLPRIKQDFPYNKIGFSDGDPSGTSASEIMEEMSCIGVLNDIGIVTEPASTNKIDPRLNAVRFFLNRMSDKKPAFVLSKKGCPVLRRGFLKNYYYKRMAIPGEERYQNEPNKNHPYSDIHDCLQYGALRFASNIVNQEKKQPDLKDIYNPAMRIF